MRTPSPHHVISETRGRKRRRRQQASRQEREGADGGILDGADEQDFRLPPEPSYPQLAKKRYPDIWGRCGCVPLLWGVIQAVRHGPGVSMQQNSYPKEHSRPKEDERRAASRATTKFHHIIPDETGPGGAFFSRGLGLFPLPSPESPVVVRVQRVYVPYALPVCSLPPHTFPRHGHRH